MGEGGDQDGAGCEGHQRRRVGEVSSCGLGCAGPVGVNDKDGAHGPVGPGYCWCAADVVAQMEILAVERAIPHGHTDALR